MTALTCGLCGKVKTVPDGAQFNGKPVEDWWAKECRSLCLDCRHSPQAAVKRPTGLPEALSAATDNATQKAGAQAAAPRAGTRRAMVLDALQQAGQTGMTFEELAQALELDYSNVGPRVRELRRDGFVAKAPFTRAASSGSQQEVWVPA
jgi:hypothetical protein